MAEVEDAIGNGPDKRSLEDKFRELERGGSEGGGGTKKDADIEDELAALKKRIRV
jgi:phage shock protein A